MHEHDDRAGPARPPRRRWRWLRRRGWPYLAGPRLAGLVAALALTLAVAACGGGGKANGVASLNGSNKPTATTTAGSSDPRQAALAFTRCMRQHGIDMPDPKFNGNQVTQEFSSGRGKVGPDDPKFKAAQQACQQLMPNAGKGGTLTSSGGSK
jgi:hypothetical protein